ncbi:hypothetical protein GUJ93_ZPchr0012g21735 [Zizania palustris]|uniref:Uncharacterized protein n=1 Tax=Zizania palustris TaxID=103762 RepID=A0A8J6BV46_ZIZPA|nr:hypothetical protein GUJ93_ZPchr0012g21735 [Zizania palustris]
MNPRISREWTAFDLAQARSVILARMNDYDAATAGGSDDDNNSKHDAIVRELRVLFPWKTTEQVIDLYVELATEMKQQIVAQPNGAAVNNYYGDDGAGVVIHDKFGPVPEQSIEVESAMNVYGHASGGVVFGSPPMLEEMSEVTNVTKAPPPVVSQRSAGRQQAAPNNAAGRFWTTDEHRQFLRGLRVYGRGDWKNISKYFVTTKTPVQVSSHAQKYFRRLATSAAGGKQRYSINDVGLDDADPWGGANNNNNYGGWKTLSFAGGHLEPAAGYGGQPHTLQASSSVAAMNNVAHQFWAHPLFNPQPQANLQQHHHQTQQEQGWIDQQMIAPAPMDGTGNIVPAASDLPEQRMMNYMF